MPSPCQPHASSQHPTWWHWLIVQELKKAKENAAAARAKPQSRFNSVAEVLRDAKVQSPTAAELLETYGVQDVSDLVRCSEVELREVMKFKFADAKRVHAALH